eukprot:260130-Pleurochrysis_carterae.AAC.1
MPHQRPWLLSLYPLFIERSLQTDVPSRISTFLSSVGLPLDLRTKEEEQVAQDNKFYKGGHWQRFCCGGGKSPDGA